MIEEMHSNQKDGKRHPLMCIDDSFDCSSNKAHNQLSERTSVGLKALSSLLFGQLHAAPVLVPSRVQPIFVVVQR